MRLGAILVGAVVGFGAVALLRGSATDLRRELARRRAREEQAELDAELTEMLDEVVQHAPDTPVKQAFQEAVAGQQDIPPQPQPIILRDSISHGD